VLAWVWLALSVASFALVARAEEADLLRRFGSEHQQYQRAVRCSSPGSAHTGPASGRGHRANDTARPARRQCIRNTDLFPFNSRALACPNDVGRRYRIVAG